jgi:hypothetical protein
MQSAIPAARAAKPNLAGALLIGYILSGLIVAFMLLDSAMHVAKPPQVVEAFDKLGFPVGLSLLIAVLAFVCAALYAVPRTSVLGAILLTGYLGGATALQVRIDGTYWFSVLMGVLAWLALYLRDERVRRLVPLGADRAERRKGGQFQ